MPFAKQTPAQLLKVGAYTTVAAAGSSSTDAAAITTAAPAVTVTASNGTKGVILPSVAADEAGGVIAIRNTVSGSSNTLLVYPYGSGTINGGSSLTLSAATSTLLLAIGADTWVSIP